MHFASGLLTQVMCSRKDLTKKLKDFGLVAAKPGCVLEEKDYDSDLSSVIADIRSHLKNPGSLSGSMIFGSMSGMRKRRDERREDIKLERSLEAALFKTKCENVVYATHWGWTPGTGVWVLDGSKESHERLANLPATFGWNHKLKLAGATYYDHCACALHYTADEISFSPPHDWMINDLRL
jgi:hypothetical protein